MELRIKTLAFIHGSTHPCDLDNQSPQGLGRLVTRIQWLRGVVCTLSSCAWNSLCFCTYFFKIGYTHYIYNPSISKPSQFTMNQEFRIGWRELCQCFLINNGGSQLIRGLTVSPAYILRKSETHTFIQLRKESTFCLFKAECLHGVLLQRLGYTDFSALVFFTLLPTCTHCTLYSWKRII